MIVSHEVSYGSLINLDKYLEFRARRAHYQQTTDHISTAIKGGKVKKVIEKNKDQKRE